MINTIKFPKKQIIFFLLLVIFDNFISSPFFNYFKIHNWKYIVAFKLVELIFGLFLNNLMFRQKIYFKLSAGKNTKILSMTIILISILSSIPNTKYLFISLIIGLCAAIPEEYLFRGIILGSLLNDNSENINKGNLLYCLITSSALFALYHIGNIQSQNLTMTIMQVFETFGMGCLFGAIYIRKGSILLSFLLHFFIDFTGTIGNGQIVNNSPSQYKYSIVVSLLYMVVLSIIAFNILKINDKSKWEFPIKDSSLNQ
ncbi:hypothetical protein FD33_GL000624 [Companilactobacillus paralimentarius DSM 13238 = JCM 10415]|jgi:CAAX amino terminal protease family.|uniref:CAAX prenyl protease 2/Lysostaphin resistance protein A-like domain-containing protein n=2 Tax=Companilactobacillus paralimentarius TaxID=83526 RepID=A0A0R1PBE6_9LACO|nr:hypothetical protein ATN96_00610 [Companilactobacillus paralimentarius]KRL29647.1 hypothetical protein FD33_GL000624 [Companilactobacillus paralimentarius DSM 13238 = JCM 10415]QFR69527.1 CPBP family intramembrane metalloprotease [Companilactobacillus paralimentarius]